MKFFIIFIIKKFIFYTSQVYKLIKNKRKESLLFDYGWKWEKQWWQRESPWLGRVDVKMGCRLVRRGKVASQVWCNVLLTLSVFQSDHLCLFPGFASSALIVGVLSCRLYPLLLRLSVPFSILIFDRSFSSFCKLSQSISMVINHCVKLKKKKLTIVIRNIYYYEDKYYVCCLRIVGI